MNFSTFINSLPQNPWVTIISLLITISAMTMSIVFYQRGRRKKSIRYCFRSDLLFEDFKEKIEGLTIKYSGKQIDTLTVTKIIFWNNGTETLNREDFLSNDKFSISIDTDYHILDASIKKINNIPIEIMISDDGKKIDIDFEYLDKKDSFIIQLFHTGNTNSNIFHVNGIIKGFGKLAEAKVSFNENFKIVPNFLGELLAWLLGWHFLIREHFIFVKIIVGIYLVLFPILVIKISIQKAKTIVPKELKELLKW